MNPPEPSKNPEPKPMNWVQSNTNTGAGNNSRLEISNDTLQRVGNYYSRKVIGKSAY